MSARGTGGEVVYRRLDSGYVGLSDLASRVNNVCPLQRNSGSSHGRISSPEHLVTVTSTPVRAGRIYSRMTDIRKQRKLCQ